MPGGNSAPTAPPPAMPRPPPRPTSKSWHWHQPTRQPRTAADQAKRAAKPAHADGRPGTATTDTTQSEKTQSKKTQTNKTQSKKTQSNKSKLSNPEPEDRD